MRGPKFQPIWLAPFKVVKTSPNRLNLTMEYLPDRSILVERGAADVKLYFQEEDHDTLGGDAEKMDFLVEDILDARGPTEDREYLVKWMYYPEEFNSWQPKENILDNELIKRADERLPAEDELEIAREPIPRKSKTSNEWKNLKVSDIHAIVAVRNTRSGQVVELTLKRDKRNNVRISISNLPEEIRNLEQVKILL